MSTVVRIGGGLRKEYSARHEHHVVLTRDIENKRSHVPTEYRLERELLGVDDVGFRIPRKLLNT